MKKSERMQKIANLNKNMESISGAAFSNSQLTYDNQAKQLEQLRIYRDEYKERLRYRGENSMTPAENNDYRYFFRSLSNAIKTQEQVLDQLSQETEKKRLAWIKNRNETEKLEKVTQNFKDDEQVEQRKKTEKEGDEINQLLHHFPFEGKLH